MRVLVYPHAMEIGGSQLNAVDLAAAVHERGHEVLVYSEDGPLVDRVRGHGIEHVLRRPSRLSPGPATARHLREVIAERGIDVVHAWEWPPILESHAAVAPGSRAAVVGSIMSMGVAGFLPSHTPLTVGTQELADAVSGTRAGRTVLLEPPVDLRENRPGEHATAFRAAFPTEAGTRQVVTVTRLAHELKLEGLLTAIEAVARLAADRPVRLVIVGDGPARHVVEAAARAANERLGREIVLLTGQLDDPRGAYDAADVCLGMGGSALRALAFGRPLVVQGEGGFFETCGADTVGQFLARGWYGIADRTPEDAAEWLGKELDRLLDDAELRAGLGAFGSDLVARRYSMDSAATALERLYGDSVASRPGAARWLGDGLAAAPRLAAYKVGRRWRRLRGEHRRDDFNARTR